MKRSLKSLAAAIPMVAMSWTVGQGGAQVRTASPVAARAGRILERDNTSQDPGKAERMARLFSGAPRMTCPTTFPCTEPLTVTPATVPTATVGKSYSAQFSGSGSGAPFTLEIAGSTPPGLNFSANGLLSGTPTQAGSFLFTVTVRSAFEDMGSRDYTLIVLPAVEVASGCPLPDGMIGVAYQTTLSARGGTPPYVFTTLSGRLPTGLALSQGGVVSGTPTVAGSFDFSLQATDQNQAIGRRTCSMRVAGDLQVGPTSLSFRANSNGAPAAPQIVQVAVEGGGLSVNVSASQTWLRATQRTGGTPFLVEVGADPTGLAPGDYAGTVEFQLGGASQMRRRVDVALRVDPAKPPMLGADPGAVSVSVPFSNQTWSRTVNLTNSGSVAASYSGSVEYVSGDGWLDASGLSGTVGRGASAALQVSSARTLPAGTYVARIRIRNATANQDLTIAVTLSVSGRTAIQLSQTGLTFRAVSGAPPPRSQSFQVLAAGDGGFNWTALTIVDDGLPAWLSLSRSSGGSGASVDVTANPAGLAPGDYPGEIRVQAPGVDNSPRSVFVALRVTPGGTAVDLELSPAGLVFIATPGQTVPAESISVFNGGAAATRLEIQLQEQPRVFAVTPPSNLNLGAGATASIAVGVNTTGLAVGTYRTSLTVWAAGGKVTPVDLLLIVTGGTRTAAVERRRAEVTCPPGGLLIVSRLQTIGFTAATGLPLPVELRVVGTDGQPLTRGGAVTAALLGGSNAVVNLTQVGSDPIRWSGTLQPPAQPTGPISLRLLAQDGGSPRTGCLDLSGTFDGTSGPVIADGGVLSAASFANGAPLAAGGLAAIFGARLASGVASASSLPLPLLLGDTRVTIAGRNVPLFFAGDQGGFTQVNGILPYGLTPNVNSQLAVRRGGLRHVVDVPVVAAQPAVFSVNQTGTGQGIVVPGASAGGLSDEVNPAAPGEIIVIYAEGLGPVNPPVEAGMPAPASPLSRVAGARVTIGGVEAEVLFAGLTPGLVGLYQINAVVPAGVAPGGAVPVVVSVGEQQSIPVTIAVRR